MDAAQALADLTEISSQIESAVLANASGEIHASTFSNAAAGERVAAAALELLREAEGTGRPGLVQLEASLDDGGSVFVVRDGERYVAAVTGPDPTVGLVFYDLKTTLRLAAEETTTEPMEPKPARRRKKTEEGEQSGGAT